jgi:RNA polymerase sigma-B factor
VSGEIKRHFRDKTWGVHVPRRIQELGLEIGHVSLILTNALSRMPTAAEIAERLGVGEDDVAEALVCMAGYSPSSLNAPVGGGDEGEFGDLMGGADPDLEAIDDKITVSELLLRLPPRERRMLAMRFYGNRTQAEIAAELGISQMHVSRLLSRALNWLREALLNDQLPRWEGADPGAEHLGLEVRVERAGAVATVVVRGEVDRDTTTRLRMALRRAIAEPGVTAVVVDLGGVPLLDAAGVAVLIDAASAAGLAGAKLTLVRARGCVAPVLAVSGLGPLVRD